MMESFDNIESYNDLNPFQSVQVKNCPSCRSIFINESECESCGYQFGKKKLGEPFGDTSFYTLYDNYWQSLPSLVRNFPRFEKLEDSEGSQFTRTLMRRYIALIDYFLFNFDGNIENRKLFLIELRDLVFELKLRNVSDRLLRSFLGENNHDLHYSAILSILEIPVVKREKLSSAILHYKVFGAFKVYKILISISLFLLMIESSLYLFQFTKR